MSTTTGDDSSAQQIRLISKLDTISEIVQHISNQEMKLTPKISFSYVNLHYVFLKEPKKNCDDISGLSLLIKTSQSDLIFIEKVISLIRDAVSNLNISNDDFNEFVEQNISRITQFYYTINEISLSDPSSVTSAKKAYNALITKIQSIQNLVQTTEKELATGFSMKHSINSINSSIEKLINIFKECQKMCKEQQKAVDGLTKLSNILVSFSDTFNLGIRNKAAQLPEISVAAFHDFRENVSKICYFSGIIDSFMKRNEAALLSAQLLFCVDDMISYYSMTSSGISYPLDFSCFAKTAQESVAKVLGSSSNSAIMSMEQTLIKVDKLFGEMKTVFEDVTIIRGLIEKLMNFFAATKDGFEEIQHRFYVGGFNEPARILRMSLVGMSFALKSIKSTVRGQNSIFNPEDVMAIPIAYKQQIDNIKKKYVNSQASEVNFITYPKVLSLYLNPSRKASSLTKLEMKKSKPGELTRNIRGITSSVTKTLNSITDLGPEVLPLFKECRSKLEDAFSILDIITRDANFPKESKSVKEELHEVCKTYDMLIDGFIETSCIPCDSLTLSDSVKSAYDIICIAAEMILKAIKKNKDLKECSSLKSIKKSFEFINTEFKIQKVVDALPDVKSGIKKITEFSKKCKQYDHTVRESYLRKALPMLLTLLESIVTSSSEFKKKEYVVGDANTDLAGACSSISTVIGQISELRTNEHISSLTKTLIDIRHHISAIRGAVIFDTPKDFLTATTKIYTQIAGLQEIVLLFKPGLSLKKMMLFIEVTQWKLSHLKSDYQYDDQLTKTMNDAIKHLKLSTKGIKSKAFIHAVDNAIEIITPYLSFFSSKTARTEENFNALHTSFNAILTLLHDQWNPPSTLPARNELNGLLRSLSFCNTIIKQPDLIPVNFEDPIEIVKGTILESFVRSASKIVDVANLYKKMSSSISIDFPNDFSKLKKALFYFSRILTEKFNVSSHISSVVETMLDVLASARIVGYEKEDFLKENATSLIGSNKNSIPGDCFNVYAHIKCIIELVDASYQQFNYEIASNLLKLLAQKQKSTSMLPDIYYYLYRVFDFEPSVRPVVSEAMSFVVHCFQGSNDISAINFTNVIHCVSQIVPKELVNINLRPNEEIPFIFDTSPYVVYKSSLVDSGIPSEYAALLPEQTVKAFTPSNKEAVEFFPQPQEQMIHDEAIINEMSVASSDSITRTYSLRSIADYVKQFSYTFGARSFQFKKISNSISPDKKPFDISLPKSMNLKAKYGYLSISVKGFRNQNCIVSLYLYDLEKKKQVSNPLFIGMKDQLPAFMHSNASTAIVELSRRSPNVILVSRVIQNDGGKLTHVAVGASRVFTKGGFLIFAQNYTDKFHSIANSSFTNDENLYQIIDANPTSTVNIKLELSIKLLHTRPLVVDTQWSNANSKFLFVPRLDNKVCCSPPLIMISNITINIPNLPKDDFIFFKAFLVSKEGSLKSPRGLKAAITPVSTNLPCYVSPKIPINSTVTFPDIIQFLIDQSLSFTSHIIIQFYTSNAKGAEKIFKFSVVNFFNEKGNMIHQSKMNVPVMKFGKCKDNKYLSYYKSTKTKLTYELSFPSHVCPPRSLSEFFDYKEKAFYDIRGMSPELLEGLLVPTVYTHLQCISAESLRKMISFLSRFNYDSVSEGFAAWTFGCFDPLSLPETFLLRFLTIYAEYMKEAAFGNDYCEQLKATKTIPYMLNILLSSMFIVGERSKKKMFNADFNSILVKLCRGLSKLIALFARLVSSKIANEHFCKFLFFCSGNVTADVLGDIILTHLQAFDGGSIELFSITAFPSSQDPEQLQAEQLPLPINTLSMIGQFSVFNVFSASPVLVAIATTIPKYRRIFTILFDKLGAVLDTKNKEFIRSTLAIICKFVETPGRFTSLTERSSPLFVPYIEIALKYYKSSLIEDSEMLESFISPILFTIQTSQPQYVFKEISDKSGTKIEIYKLIGALFHRFVAQEDISTSFLVEFTKRILNILNLALDSPDDYSEQFVPISEMAPDLLCAHQSSTLIVETIQMFCKILDRYPKQCFIERNGIIANLCFGMMNLAERVLPAARDAPIAFFYHMFSLEYEYTQGINASSDAFSAAFISEGVKSNKSDACTYYEMLSSMITLFSSSMDAKLGKLIENKMELLKSVYRSAVNWFLLAPEKKAQTLLKLIPMFKTPAFILAMLNTISLEMSNAQMWHPSFLAKIEACNLVNTVSEMFSDKEMRNIGARMKFQKMGTSSFSKKKLSSLLNDALMICIKANMKCVSSPIFDTLCYMRNRCYRELGMKVEEIKANTELCTDRIYYYLVSDLSDGTHMVYCSHNSTLSSFTSFINDAKANRFVGMNFAVPFAYYGDAAAYTGKYTIVPLKETEEQNVFTNTVESKSGSITFTFITKEMMPTLTGFSVVTNVKSATKLKDAMFNDKFDKNMKKVTDATLVLEREMNKIKNKSEFNRNTSSMIRALQDTLLDPKIVSTIVEKKPEKAKVLISKSERALKALKIALDEGLSKSMEGNQVVEDGNDLLLALSLQLKSGK